NSRGRSGARNRICTASITSTSTSTNGVVRVSSMKIMQDTRFPAVAGTFYPEDAQILIETVERLLAAVTLKPDSEMHRPKALIVPHAGYVYSGPVAASAY